MSMSFAGSVEDRLAIRERIEAYSDAVFQKDAEAWIANWCEDGVWSLPGISVSGKAQIKAAWMQAMEAFALAAFFATPGAIVVDGATAKARVHTQEILIDAAGAVRRIIGAYDDELVKVADVWLFRRRAYRILHDRTEG
jgi:ketosteroid isomerase-like protein